MKHETKEGARLWKKITVRTFNEGNKRPFVKTFLARPGFGFTEEEVDKYLQHVSEEIEKRFPGHEYELVELTGGHFNFVWRGRREAGPSQEPVSA